MNNSEEHNLLFKSDMSMNAFIILFFMLFSIAFATPPCTIFITKTYYPDLIASENLNVNLPVLGIVAFFVLSFLFALMFVYLVRHISRVEFYEDRIFVKQGEVFDVSWEEVKKISLIFFFCIHVMVLRNRRKPILFMLYRKDLYRSNWLNIYKSKLVQYWRNHR